MVEYRGTYISIAEAPEFMTKPTRDNEKAYRVSGGKSMIYKAESEYGCSFALNPADAVEGAKEQIDRILDLQ